MLHVSAFFTHSPQSMMENPADLMFPWQMCLNLCWEGGQRGCGNKMWVSSQYEKTSITHSYAPHPLLHRQSYNLLSHLLQKAPISVCIATLATTISSVSWYTEGCLCTLKHPREELKGTPMSIALWSASSTIHTSWHSQIVLSRCLFEA